LKNIRPECQVTGIHVIISQINSWSAQLSTPISLNDPFTLFLFIMASVMMIGYGIGRWVNRRRARRISDWLEPGLRSLGGRPTVQHVTRSAFRIQVADARRPFRTITASVVLISREVLPTWMWERLKGHDDLLVLHVTFRHPPAVEAEMVDPDNELGQRGELQAREYNWAHKEIPPRWRLYYARDRALPRLESIAGQVAASPFAPLRLALRQDAPHMLLSMPMPEMEQVQSRQLIDMLVRLSELTLAPGGGNGRG
jgi:hypothetical protein